MFNPFKSLIKAKLFFISIFILSTNIFVANAKFSVEHDITYQVLPSKETLVTQNIIITNQENDVIATNYTHTTRNVDIYDLKGSEGENNLSLKKEIVDDFTNITAIFDNITIGKGTTKKFTISYKTKQIVTKVGNVYNINIPKAKIVSDTTLYNVLVKIPNEFGENLFISPNPQIQKTNEDAKLYYFTKEDLLNNGITASFGENQLLNFKLIYQLQNKSFFTTVSEIVIPSDIKNYQQVSLDKIIPKPTKIYFDKDNNLIAQYKIKANTKVQIEVLGSVKLFTKQIDLSKGGSFKDIPNYIKNTYTKSKKFWESDKKIIQSNAQKLFLPQKNVSENAYEIYKYIINNFEYDNNVQNQSFVNRKGAYNTISSKNPISCMEFTDVFIALARSNKIPAREINGYAISNYELLNTPQSINLKNGDLLHSWAEFYDPNFGWVQIDPTWGNTSKMDYFSKLDTNHFSLVVRGVNSEYPLPAGMYRYNENTKLLNIDYSNDASGFMTLISIKKVLTLNPLHYLLGYSKFKIENIGNTIIYGINKNPLVPTQKTFKLIKNQELDIKYKDINDIEYTFKIKN